MPDYLSCGSCPVDFELADIVSFIDHKRRRCLESVEADLLECNKCSKRFHTPWPLLFHIQLDHQILVVRNLKNIDLPLITEKVPSPHDQIVESMSMFSDQCISNCHVRYQERSTQTTKRNNIACCKPTNMPPCCKKVEPQCFEEPCACPSNGIYLPDICYYSCDNIPKENSKPNLICCVCPQSSIKKESREVQTDFEYIEDVDINFLLSNPDGSSNETFPDHMTSSLPQQSVNFTTQYPMQNDKTWGYLSQTDNQLSESTHTNYIQNYENSNYQMILNEIRLQTPNNTDFMDSNHGLSVDQRTPSPTNQHNLNLALNNENVVFPYKNNCLKEQSLMNHSTLFQETNNTFPFNMPPVEQDKLLMNNILPNHQSLNKEIVSRQPLISSNENCSMSYYQNQRNYATEFGNTENIELEKLESEKKEFRFLCPNCGKRFRQKVHLRKHVMSQHARQKPHKCSQCGYTTVEKSHLTVHIRTHTGERPYTCRRCNYSSAQNCTLKSHYLRRHPGDQIDCNLCGSSYITEQERNNHQRSCRIVNGMSLTSSNSFITDSADLPNNNLKPI